LKNAIGGSGSDKITGNQVDNKLTGGRGSDTLTGKAGDDRFDFNSVKDSVVGGKRDTITDFKRGQDKIDLQSIDANTEKGGNQKFKFIGTKAFGETPGQVRFKDTTLQGDVNGDGKADFEIKVSLSKLTADDFVL
jgi:serralysin